MLAYHVHRSTLISATPEQVFDTVVDFSTWTRWSPWLGVDKEAKVTVSDDPRSLHSTYHWTGELVGEGEIEHVELDRPRQMLEEIRFFKPFKSKSGVGFDIEPQGDSTKITWHMRGKLPWFLFWMKANMETFIGMDYERGLKMLREFIETGEVLSQTEVLGVESMADVDMFGISDSAPHAAVGPVMEKAIKRVDELFEKNQIATDGEMLSVYHPIDLKAGRFDFTTGYTVSPSDSAPEGLKHCHLPGGQALHIRHIGSYDNLGNAWSGAYQYARYKKLKIARRDAYEIYRNDPSTTPEAEWCTDIYMPLK